MLLVESEMIYDVVLVVMYGWGMIFVFVMIGDMMVIIVFWLKDGGYIVLIKKVF